MRTAITAIVLFVTANAHAQTDLQKLQRAAQLINALQIQASQAELVTQLKRDIAEVAETIAKQEEEKRIAAAREESKEKK